MYKHFKTNKNKQLNKNRMGKYKILLIVIIPFIIFLSIIFFKYINLSNKLNQGIDFDEDEVMRINNQKVVMNEFLLYAADVYQGYNLQNESDWDNVITDSSNNNITFEQHVKGTICEQIRMTKVLCMKAKDDGIVLSNDEINILVDNAQTYYSNLKAASVVSDDLTVNLITQFYKENALAQKIYNNIVERYSDNQDSALKSNYDETADLSEKELYFLDKYNILADKYNSDYNYYTSINWDLLELISFSQISKDETKE